MKIAIVDDLATERTALNANLQRFCNEHLLNYTIDEYSSGDQLLAGAVLDYDLIFLDIFMEGTDGLQVAGRLRELDCQALIIFCTTSTDCAIQSYRLRAFDYLVKPIAYEQLCETMELCVKRIATASRYIQIKSGRKLTNIFCKDIIYVDYSNHYVLIHLKDATIHSQMYFDDFALLLKNDPQFLLCNRNCLINMDKVAKIEDGDFITEDGQFVAISKTNFVKVRQDYAAYVFHKLNGAIL